MLLNACSTAVQSGPAPAAKPMPSWPGEQLARSRFSEPTFVGVGMSDLPGELGEVTASNRARWEIAGMFDVFSASLMKGYMQNPASTGVIHVALHIRSFIAITSNKVQIAETYRDPNTGAVFAMAVLPLTAFLDALPRLEKSRDGFDPRMLEYARDHARETFAEVVSEHEEERQGNPP